MWDLQRTTEKELRRSVIETHDIFKVLSPQTIFLLSYELLETRRYEAGDVISIMNKRSPFNVEFSGVFQNQISTISVQLKRQERQRLKVDRDNSPELNITIASQNIHSPRIGMLPPVKDISSE